ncbi:MAG: ribosomal protein S18-alanine N-acetyltransferase [Oscillospiraceae bacterium]
MNNVIIRQAAERDLPVFAEIESVCIAEPWSVESFRAEFAASGAVFLAAERDGVICGFLTASSVLDEVNINNVAVLSEYRRNGIGEKLLRALEEQVSGFAAVINLEVRESNLPAISLYKKLGYAQNGLRKNFYRQPVENAVLMSKTV